METREIKYLAEGDREYDPILVFHLGKSYRNGLERWSIVSGDFPQVGGFGKRAESS